MSLNGSDSSVSIVGFLKIITRMAAWTRLISVDYYSDGSADTSSVDYYTDGNADTSNVRKYG